MRAAGESDSHLSRLVEAGSDVVAVGAKQITIRLAKVLQEQVGIGLTAEPLSKLDPGSTP